MIDNTKKLKMDELDKVSGGQISGDEAYAAALEHVKKKSNSVKLKKNEYVFEYGKMIYDIEFIEGDMKYKMQVDAEDGSVLKYEKDLWD